MPLLNADTRILTIPGLDNSGPAHWQSLWEHKFEQCDRIDLGQWSEPDRDLWVSRIAQAIGGERGPILIAAHSLGCHAFTHWFARALRVDQAKIAGALLVAPPDLRHLATSGRVKGFEQSATFTSRVPMIAVGSDNDVYAKTSHVWRLSRQWDARFVNAGPLWAYQRTIRYRRLALWTVSSRLVTTCSNIHAARRTPCVHRRRMAPPPAFTR